jgi:hypothetical protein
MPDWKSAVNSLSTGHKKDLADDGLQLAGLDHADHTLG